MSNQNKFSIICNFTRSYDKSHIKNNRIHLISSNLIIDSETSDLLIENAYKLFNGNLLNPYAQQNEIFYIFNVEEDNLFNNSNTDYEINAHKNICIIHISLDRLIWFLGLNIKTDKNDIFSNVFGDLEQKNKDFENICQNSIFIFSNQLWSTILLKFKLNNIDISGGSSPKRHILQTVDYLLIHQFQILTPFINYKRILEIIYKSSKNPILSSSLPIDFYNTFLINKENILNYLVKDINNYPNINNIKLIVNEEFNNENSTSLLNIIINNLKLVVNLLIKDLIKPKENEIENLNKENERIKSDMSTILSELNNIEEVNIKSTRYMSNKEKKRFKKERTLINQNKNNEDYLTKLKLKIFKFEAEIEKNNQEIDSILNDINKFRESINNYSVLELYNKHNSSKINYQKSSYKLKKYKT